MSTLSDLKVQVMLNHRVAFFASLMLNLEIIEADIPTAATNGISIKFNVPWLNTLTLRQREFVMLHEICHIIFKHALRMGDRDAEKWNVATDYAINAYLVFECGYPIIEGCLLDEAYKGMSAEDIYNLLPDEPKEDTFIGSDLEEGDGEGTVDTSAVEQQIEDMLVQAAQATGAGNMPASIQRYINELLNPILPWEVLLDRYVTDKAKEDYSYARRNRRYTDLIVPTLYSEQIGTVSVYVDASCSVTEEEFSQYVAEFSSIKDKLDPTLMEVISFDTRIFNVHTVTSGEPLNIELVGGGGTCLKEVAERINDSDSEVVILFTDGYYSPVEYDKEVLHVIVNNKGYKNNQDNPVIHIQV